MGLTLDTIEPLPPSPLRVMNVGVPSHAVIQALHDQLTAQQRIDHLSRLRAYVVDTRGWRTNVTTLSDLQGLVDRYEPSGRQWAMRFLAQVKDMAVSELYLTELRIDSTTETWAVAT